MDKQRTALLADIDNWTACANALVAMLDTNSRALDDGRAMIGSEQPLVEAIGAMSTAARFLNMSSALTDFELARFRLRSSLIGAALAEGLSEERLAETLGVPEDFVGKFLTDLHTGPEATDA